MSHVITAVPFLQQSLNLTDEQLEKLFFLRRAYLQKSAVLSGQQRDLQQQLQNQSSIEDQANLEMVQMAHQVQDNNAQLEEAFMQYLGLICDGVRHCIGLLDTKSSSPMY